MRSNHHSPVFEKIKQTLDPEHSYVIFEKVAQSTDKYAFREVFDIFSQLDFDIFEWKIYHDETIGSALLVIKVDPGRTDGVVQDVLTIGLPGDVTLYSYGRRIEG